MRVGAAILALASAIAGGSAQAVPPGLAPFVSIDAPVVVLTNARVVDGRGVPARDGQTIVIRDGRIEAAGPSGATRVPSGAHVVDLTGHTVMPGIVGLHEHTYFGGVRTMTQMRASGAPLYLAFGVTTAMTAGSQFPYQELNLKARVDAGLLPGPRLLITGPYLNGGPLRTAASRLVETPDDVRRVIGYWASEGATWFKFQGTVTREVLKAGIDEAHARGLRVTGHLCSVTFTEAAAMGIDALQHGFITNSDYAAGKAPDVCPPGNMRAQADVDVDSPEVQASIRAIAASGTAVVSTLGVYETFMPGRFTPDARALEMFDPEVRKEVEAAHADLATSALTVPDRLLTKMMAWERAFVAAGGLLGAGSDPWGTGFLPGFGNLRNIELLVEAGFTFEEAVRISTLNGARILGEDRTIGSIEPGKQADLIVVRGNPVATPAAIYDVVTVFKQGRGYDSQKLREAARGKVGAS